MELGVETGMEIVSEINARLGTKANPMIMLEVKTVQDLAARLNKEMPTPAPSMHVRAEPSAVCAMQNPMVFDSQKFSAHNYSKQ